MKSRMKTFRRLTTDTKNFLKKSSWLAEDYREPTKQDFIRAKYRVIEFPWEEAVDCDGVPVYGKTPIPLWAIKRYSPKYGWTLITVQIVPYYYEPMAFKSKKDADNYKSKIEDPQSPCFDGMVNYIDQNKALFDLTFFPKD